MNEDYPSAVTIANDYSKGTLRKVGNGQRPNVQTCKERYASYKRSGRTSVEACQSKKGQPSATDLATINELIRDIRNLGLRVVKVGKLAWKIDSSEEGGTCCLLIGSEGKQGWKPGSNEGGDCGMGRSKKKGKRSRNGTRSIRRSHKSRHQNGRGAGSVR